VALVRKDKVSTISEIFIYNVYPLVLVKWFRYKDEISRLELHGSSNILLILGNDIQSLKDSRL